MNLLRVIQEKPWKQQTASGLPLENEVLTAQAPQKVALMFFLAVVTVMIADATWL